jgi:hypothetical protein
MITQDVRPKSENIPFQPEIELDSVLDEFLDENKPETFLKDFYINIYIIMCKDINITERYVGRAMNFEKRRKEHEYSSNKHN